MNWWAYGAFLLFFPGLPLAAEWGASRLAARLRSRGKRASGRIISQRTVYKRYGTKGLPVPTARFTTHTGQVIMGEAVGNKWLPGFRIGDEAGVVYEVANPAVFMFEQYLNEGVSWGYVTFLLTVTGLLTWLVVANS
ncbi:MAG: hypothetical protein ACRYFX_25460 [Janthinobacterium lividum]